MLLSFILGIIVGILLSITSMLSQRIGSFLKDLPKKYSNQQAIIVSKKNPLDIDLT